MFLHMGQQTPVLNMPGCMPNAEAYMIVLLLCVVQGSLNDTGFGADVMEGKLCRGGKMG